jgi:hypothetical protein
MRFDLRSLMILAAIIPPLATMPWWINHPKWSVHQAAGAFSIASYSLALLALAGVYWNTPNWRRPPKKTPLVWLAIAASIVSAAAAFVYFITFPRPPLTDHERAQNYKRERALDVQSYP